MRRRNVAGQAPTRGRRRRCRGWDASWIVAIQVIIAPAGPQVARRRHRALDHRKHRPEHEPRRHQGEFRQAARWFERANDAAPAAIAGEFATYEAAYDEYLHYLSTVDFNLDVSCPPEGKQLAIDTSHTLTPGRPSPRAADWSSTLGIVNPRAPVPSRGGARRRAVHPPAGRFEGRAGVTGHRARRGDRPRRRHLRQRTGALAADPEPGDRDRRRDRHQRADVHRVRRARRGRGERAGRADRPPRRGRGALRVRQRDHARCEPCRRSGSDGAGYSIVAGSGDPALTFTPGEGARDVDLVRDVLDVNDALVLHTDVSAFVVVTDGSVDIARRDARRRLDHDGQRRSSP